MLGDKLGVIRGMVTGLRVLPGGGGPQAETTFDVSGNFAGVDTNWVGTYWTVLRPDGTGYGECPHQGIVMTAGGAGTWTAAGAGWLTGDGTAMSFRGAVYLRTAPPELVHLLRSALIYEWDIDAKGNAVGTFWDWK